MSKTQSSANYIRIQCYLEDDFFRKLLGEFNKVHNFENMAAQLLRLTCAVMLVMFNKAALSTYRFPCANVISTLR